MRHGWSRLAGIGGDILQPRRRAIVGEAPLRGIQDRGTRSGALLTLPGWTPPPGPALLCHPRRYFY
jgi:hypothetical protein